MRLEKRDNRSWVYLAAALTVAAVLGMIYLIWMGKSALLTWGNLVLALYFGALVVWLVLSFFRQLRDDLYSYNTILFAGFALFVLSLFVTHLVAAVQAFREPESFSAARMLFTLLHSAKNYMLLTSPLLLLFSAALFFSNLALIRHEGRRFVNILGILLALSLTAGEVLIAYLDFRSAFTRRGILAKNLAVNLMAAFYLYFECMIVGAITADWIAAKHQARKDKDYLIVLGCGIRRDGTPTPLLRGRLELALRFDREQRAESGKAARFVVSGGQGSDETQSEAAAMRAYLLGCGVPEARILTEDRSVSTAENMRFSRAVIDADTGAERAPRAAFFTTNYHVFRAGLKARQAGLRVEGMGAPTKWYFWPNAAVREFVGLLTEHRGKQAFVLSLLTLVYVCLTVFAYA